MTKQFVPARFIGGPWGGEVRDIPEIMDRVYAPLIEAPDVSPETTIPRTRVAVYSLVDNWPARYRYEYEKWL